MLLAWVVGSVILTVAGTIAVVSGTQAFSQQRSRKRWNNELNRLGFQEQGEQWMKRVTFGDMFFFPANMRLVLNSDKPTPFDLTLVPEDTHKAALRFYPNTQNDPDSDEHSSGDPAFDQLYTLRFNRQRAIAFLDPRFRERMIQLHGLIEIHPTQLIVDIHRFATLSDAVHSLQDIHAHLMGAQSVGERLVAMLVEDIPALRMTAAKLLTPSDLDEKMRQILLHQLPDLPHNLLILVAELLGPLSVQALIDRFEKADLERQKQLLHLFGILGGSEAKTFLRHQLTQAELQPYAAVALAQADEEEIQSVLIAAFVGTTHTDQRVMLIQAMAQHPEERTESDLLIMLSDQTMGNREKQAVIKALGATARSDAIEPLLKMRPKLRGSLRVDLEDALSAIRDRNRSDHDGMISPFHGDSGMISPDDAHGEISRTD